LILRRRLIALSLLLRCLALTFAAGIAAGVVLLVEGVALLILPAFVGIVLLVVEVLIQSFRV